MWKQPHSVSTHITHPYTVKHSKQGNNRQNRVELYLTEVNNSEANLEIVQTLWSWKGCGVLLHSTTDSQLALVCTRTARMNMREVTEFTSLYYPLETENLTITDIEW